MASHEPAIRQRRPRRAADAPTRSPRAPAQAGRCPGAAAQLAAVHRTLRHGPVRQLQMGGKTAGAPATAARAAAPNRTGLPDRLKAGVESLSGVSLDEVRVHYNSSKPARLDAHAYAQGSDIHLAPGQERHLPHEAWHVVQQAQGRVKPTLQMKDGRPVNDDSALEREADAMARMAEGRQPVPRTLRKPPPATAAAPIQGAFTGMTKPLYSKIKDKIDASGDEELAKEFELQYKNRDPITFVWWIRRNTKDEALKSKLIGLDPNSGLNKARERSSKAREESLAMRRGIIQPDSLVLLHQTLTPQVEDYGRWLFNGQNWQGRSNDIQAKLIDAKKVYQEAIEQLQTAQKKFPLLESTSREQILEYEATNALEIRAEVDGIRDFLVEIDSLVKEPPVPPKTWDAFMGNRRLYKYADGNTPIPVIFYKDEKNYAPIVVPDKNKPGVKAGTYSFPNGPTVKGRNGTYKITVDNSNRFRVGTELVNSKDSNDRSTQIDINYALRIAGVNMNNKDGDHVRDLGFGGKDRADNYWPLEAKINRRPFLGWRGAYGINYKSGNDHKTASITALAGKKLVIDDFMKSGDDNVPEIGQKPDPKSGVPKKDWK